MVGIADLACKFSRIKAANMFSIYVHSGVPGYVIWRFIVVIVYTNVDPKLLRQHG